MGDALEVGCGNAGGGVTVPNCFVPKTLLQLQIRSSQVNQRYET